MLICSIPNSKGKQISERLAKELHLNFFNFDGDNKTSKGWEGWIAQDGTSHKISSLKKWVLDETTIYHTHLLPNLASHKKALELGKIAMITRDPHDIIGSLPIQKRSDRTLELLRRYKMEWEQNSRDYPGQVSFIQYSDVVKQDNAKSCLTGIAKHLGLNWEFIQKKPYSIIIK